MLAVIESHPVQYHAPVYRALQAEHGIPVTAIYGSDVSVAGYHDVEFGVSFAWDTDLLAGYDSHFLIRCSSTNGGKATPADASDVAGLLERLRPSAVMLLGYGSQFDRRALFAAWRSSIPTIFRGETTDHAVSRTRTRGWLRDNALSVLYSQMAQVMYIGQHSLKHFERLGVPHEKLTFAPYCVATNVFDCDEQNRLVLRSATRDELGLLATDIVLLFSGKISERKGPDLLIEAVKLVPEPLRSRVCVCFLGDGHMRSAVRAMAEATPIVRTSFPGFQNQTHLSRYYHAADALVLPSRSGETWGLVVNEALHHGVPCVVSSAVGCAPDLIAQGETGFIFESGSVTELAKALISATTLMARPDTRKRCRQQVSRYTVSDATNGIANAYTRVASGRRVREPRSAIKPV